MKNLTVWLSCFVWVFAVSCSKIAEIKTPVGTISGPSVSGPKVPTVIQRGLSASNIFEGDEYIVTRSEDNNWGDYGKMLTPPSAVAAEAEFLIYRSGQKEWSNVFFKLKPATATDLTVGNDVFYFRDNEREGVYHLPTERSNARQGYWYRGLIIDTSLLGSRGILYVKEDKVDKDNVFIALK